MKLYDKKYFFLSQTLDSDAVIYCIFKIFTLYLNFGLHFFIVLFLKLISLIHSITLYNAKVNILVEYFFPDGNATLTD